MLKKWKVVLGMVSALVLIAALVPQAALAQGGPGGKRVVEGHYAKAAGRGNDTRGLYYTDATIDPAEEEALLMAIDDEYKALATYLGVMEQFGQAAPFVSIARAEEQHIAALERLLDRYGLDVPENEWIGNTPEFESLTSACEAGVQAEIDNAALYDQLFAMVDNPDIVQVFTNLRNASESSHLPAFASCAEGDGTYVPGSGMGAGAGIGAGAGMGTGTGLGGHTGGPGGRRGGR